MYSRQTKGGDRMTEMDIEAIKNVIKSTRIATTSYTHSQIYEIILRSIDNHLWEVKTFESTNQGQTVRTPDTSV